MQQQLIPRLCSVCGEPNLRSAGAKTCSKRCKERLRSLDGSNRQRMRERIAREHGLTLAEYEEQQSKESKERTRKRRVWQIRITYANHNALLRAVTMAHREELRRSYTSSYMLARYHADPDNWSTRKKRRRLFERDGWQCRVCGDKVDDALPATHPRRAVAMHIVAKARGGEWTEENMATGCYRCNVADGVNQLPIQFTISGL